METQMKTMLALSLLFTATVAQAQGSGNRLNPHCRHSLDQVYQQQMQVESAPIYGADRAYFRQSAALAKNQSIGFCVQLALVDLQNSNANRFGLVSHERANRVAARTAEDAERYYRSLFYR